MSASYSMAMPIVIYNLGVEMIYVLCSRLKAQAIPEDKSIKVIHDVVASLFEKKFISEIQKRQEMAKHLAVRQLFEKLAHSSIMRLNSTSMNKLFDLMLMSLKLQMLRLKFPEEIFQITMNHLNSLIEILNTQDAKGNDDVMQLVKDSVAFIHQNYANISPYDWIIMRQTILRFLQGKNVKVSIFIQDNLQSQAGVIYLPMNELAPPATKKPGAVVKYGSNGKVEKEYTLTLKLTSIFQENKSLERVKTVTTELGKNIYLNDRKPGIPGKIVDMTDFFNSGAETKEECTAQVPLNTKNPISNNIQCNTTVTSTPIETAQANAVVSISTSVIPNTSITTLTSTDDYLNTEQRQKNILLVKKEFNELSDLLNIAPANESNTFKLDLFKIPNSKKGAYNANEVGEDDIIEIERDSNVDKIKSKFEDCFNIEEDTNKADDDLLDLMDMASKK